MYNDLRDEVHINAISKGFWDVVNLQRILALINSEVGELIEADRSNKKARTDLYSAAMRGGEIKRIEAFKAFMKDSVGDELADIFIRLLDYAGHKNADLDGASEIYSKTLIKDSENFAGSNESFFTQVNSLFGVISRIADREQQEGLQTFECGVWVIGAITTVERIAAQLEIDIMYHVQEKMLYNAGREHMHGKKY